MGLWIKNFDVEVHWQIWFLEGREVDEKLTYRGNCLRSGVWTVCRFKVGGLVEKRGWCFWGGFDASIHTICVCSPSQIFDLNYKALIHFLSGSILIETAQLVFASTYLIDFLFPKYCLFLLCLPLEVFLFLFSICCFCWHLYGTSLAVIFHLPWFRKMIHIRFHVILMKSTAVDMKCISLCNDFQWNNSHRIILLVFFKDTHLYVKNILVFTLK